MNRNITNLGNGSAYLETQMQSHQYVRALRTRFISDKRTVIFSFESCSGGGGRNDLAAMRYFPQVWASDNTDAINAYHSIRFILFCPTISMGAHVSAQIIRWDEWHHRNLVVIAKMWENSLRAWFGQVYQMKRRLRLLIRWNSCIKNCTSSFSCGNQYRLPLNPDAESNEAVVQFNLSESDVALRPSLYRLWKKQWKPPETERLGGRLYELKDKHCLFGCRTHVCRFNCYPITRRWVDSINSKDYNKKRINYQGGIPVMKWYKKVSSWGSHCA